MWQNGLWNLARENEFLALLIEVRWERQERTMEVDRETEEEKVEKRTREEDKGRERDGDCKKKVCQSCFDRGLRYF